ncbi:MAG: serine hydrolase [Bacteroidales bacterium]|nr:serine hydrolase [Candidatus Cacconaster equifaecalis]
MRKILLFALAALVSCAPESLDLPRGKASKSMDEAFATYIDATAKADKQEMHSVMVVQHGKVLEETWLNGGAPDLPHELWSVSKTFTSTAVGFAIDEGYFNIDDKLIDFFPDKLPEVVSENLAAVTVHDLLCMSCGHDKEPSKIMSDPNAESDWIKSILEWPVEHEPGTFFCYNSLGTFMLSAIVTKTTGQKVVDYLQPRLFDPLGIEAPAWSENPQGINCGGWGLKLKTEDLAKMGVCILNEGKYNGRQVIPADYVKQMTAKQIDCCPAGMTTEEAAKQGLNAGNSDWVQGYCLQMWRSRNNAVRADGAYGQYILIIPDKDAVVVTTAKVNDMQLELNLIWDYIYPQL